MAGRLAGGCPIRRVPDEKPPMKADVDKTVIQEVLRDLRHSLEAYLVEWRREFGIRGASETGIARIERLPAATEREKEGVAPPDPASKTSGDS